ncbi:hypothetical protein BT96DRAFT_917552 [Gymnopus androsaceus JB14]|uniref:Uncharacterized protein n=1 Tax=Gymnopus androsaceus JB14 TaxID=1447944 RepID=A0A6A4I2P5_9AGAR|nr:hypothetical protein BT96DRAFT_917552 [Gymnopus androsaceus JB14]
MNPKKHSMLENSNSSPLPSEYPPMDSVPSPPPLISSTMHAVAVGGYSLPRPPSPAIPRYWHDPPRGPPPEEHPQPVIRGPPPPPPEIPVFIPLHRLPLSGERHLLVRGGSPPRPPSPPPPEIPLFNPPPMHTRSWHDPPVTVGGYSPPRPPSPRIPLFIPPPMHSRSWHDPPVAVAIREGSPPRPPSPEIPRNWYDPPRRPPSEECPQPVIRGPRPPPPETPLFIPPHPLPPSEERHLLVRGGSPHRPPSPDVPRCITLPRASPLEERLHIF